MQKVVSLFRGDEGALAASEKRNQWYARMVVYGILFVAYFVNFYVQAVELTASYGFSDAQQHIQIALSMLGRNTKEIRAEAVGAYPAPYVLLLLFGWLFGNYEVAISFLSAAAAVVTALLSEAFLRDYAGKLISSRMRMLLAALLGIVAAIDIPFITRLMELDSVAMRAFPDVERINFQFVTLGTTPLHNYTCILCRPVAILSFWIFLKVLQNFAVLKEREFTAEEKQLQNKLLVLLSASLILSNLFKPSFFQIMGPAAVLLVVFYLCSTGFKRAILYCVKIGLAFVPPLVELLVAMSSSLGVSGFLILAPFEVVSYYCTRPVLAAVMTNLFSIFVVCVALARKKLSSPLAPALVIFLVGLLEAWLLAESYIPQHANLVWGYIIGQYLLYLAAIPAFVRMTQGRTRGVRALRGIGWTLFGLHVFSGLLAFFRVYIVAAKNYLKDFIQHILRGNGLL